MACSKELSGSPSPTGTGGVLFTNGPTFDPIRSGPDVITSVCPAAQDASHSEKRSPCSNLPWADSKTSGRPEGAPQQHGLDRKGEHDCARATAYLGGRNPLEISVSWVQGLEHGVHLGQEV